MIIFMRLSFKSSICFLSGWMYGLGVACLFSTQGIGWFFDPRKQHALNYTNLMDNGPHLLVMFYIDRINLKYDVCKFIDSK